MDDMSISLGELLDDAQGAHVEQLIVNKDKHALREYLRSLSAQLEAKGVLPDYLYYWLCWKFDLY